jgi:excisionase family DNA binding protein
MDRPLLLTQPEAADYLRLSERTLERLRVNGGGPRFIKAGRRVLYRAEDIEAWVQSRTFGSTAEVEVA